GRPEHLGLGIARSVQLLKERPKGRGVRFRGRFTPRDGGQGRIHDLPEDPGVALLAPLPVQPIKRQFEGFNLWITRLGGFRSVCVHGLPRISAFPPIKESTMDTIPKPFSLRNPSANPLARRGGFRVPYGLKDGRVWAPSEVPRGKACGCSCPGCHAPLAAKALESRRKRAHFAHLTDTGCQTGRETGIHERAKQLIADHQRMVIPAWTGDLIDMPNPPHARDDDGRLYWGRQVDLPSRIAELHDIEIERSFGSYKPDVVARDEMGELLIEIRVTHAVDDVKAARVQAQSGRMVEIDLSQLHRDIPHDLAAFEHAVLDDAANRNWISFPEAVAEWQASKLELDEQVATKNHEIAQLRDQMAKAAQARQEREAQETKDKEGRKAYMRRQKRAKHAEDLDHLMALTSPERIDRILREYR